MTTTYVFRNPGVIDPRSITTFGVSSKEGSNPIGFFGTGLKYAIAVLLRLRCSIKIYSGENKIYEFSVEKTRIRVNDFDLVLMNGVPCGFTTELGKTWEIWQAFRELACNCIDEAGTYYSAEDEFQIPACAETHVLVTGEPFSAAWAERHSVILNNPETVCKTDDVSAHPGVSGWVYYRGVRVHELHQPSALTYNLHARMDLTEDRTLKYDFYVDTYVSRLYQRCEQPDVVRRAVLASKETFEGNLGFSGSCGATFTDVVTKEIRAFNPLLNVSAAAMVRKGNLSGFLVDETAHLDSVDRQRLRTAIAFCKRIGFPVDEYPIIVSSTMGDSVIGLADGGKIYISKRAFHQGTKMVAGTLIEEFLHLRNGVYDETRQMQNLLIDTICSLGERITRKPL